MSPRVLLFPGQGSQVVGMGRALARAHPAASAVFGRADAALGLPLSQRCFEGPAEALTATAIAQPALLTHAIAILAAIEATSGPVAFHATGGHSLGEWSALVVAGAIDFEDAVRLVHLRGRLMQDAVPHGVGAMAAALGLDAAMVSDLCAAASVGDELVVPATYNGGGNIVVSGHRPAVERFIAAAAAAGARALPVEVSAPFHSPLMAPVEEPLRAALDGVEVRAPRVRVRSTARDTWLETAAAVRDALTAQLVAPVLWKTCVEALAATGADEAWVFGPGKSLARMVQRLRLPWRVRAVGGPEDLDEERSAP